MQLARTTGIVLALVGVGALSRLLPHPPNATALTTISLLARKELGVRAAYAIPLATLAVTDALIGWYDWQLMVFVYGSFALTAALSGLMPPSRPWLSVILLPLVASLLFFLITNGAVWAFSPWYEKTSSGLISAYTMGLPFFRYMLVGDLVYLATATGVLQYLAAPGIPRWCVRLVQNSRA